MNRKKLAIASAGRVMSAWSLAAWVALAATPRAAIAQTSPMRFPVANTPIIAAMQQKQIPVSGVAIRLAAPITSSVDGPMLVVRSLTVADKHTAQLLVGCRYSAECLPFYVTVSWPVEIDVSRLTLAPALTPDAKAKNRKDGIAQEMEGLRAGAPATLLLDGGRVHVTLRVVCLENQQADESIRVTTPDRHQQYVASVLAPGVLKGSF